MFQANRVAAFLATSALALCLPQSVAAQSADGEARLDEVIVTAQRVEQNIQDVPVSVSTVSGDVLDNLSASAADIRFLSARVPSVVAESSFGRAFPRFYIRGIGNTDFDLNATQPVSLVYDEVPYESPILKGFPVFDVEGIEVLRGPQGTLFGRNTPGGIIKFDSVKPGDETSGYVSASYGSFDTYEVEGAVGGRLSDDFAVRISGLYQERSDFVDNDFTGEDDKYEGFEEFAWRAQALWSPFDNDFTALLNVHGRTNDSDARLFRANIIQPGTGGLVPDFDYETVFFDGALAGSHPLSQETFGTTLKAEMSLSDVLSVAYIFGWETAEIESRGDIDGGFGAAFLPFQGPGVIPFPSESGGAVDDLDQVTHELRFVYDAQTALTGQFGFFLFDEEVAITSRSFDTLAPGQPVNGIATREGDTDAWAVFGSADYAVTDRLSVGAGARYTDETKGFSVERQLSPFGAGPLGPITGSVGDEQVSWDVSALYDVSDELNVFTRIAKGFRGPSIQGRLVFGDTVSIADSETVLSYEAGFKSELLGDRLRLNGAAFFFELEDQQLTVVGGVNNTVQLLNADQGEGYGFELDAQAAPTADLLLTAGLSYNKTEIKDADLEVAACGAPCTILDPFRQVPNPFAADGDGFDEIANVNGNSFPNAPEWIANFTARYGVPVGNGEVYGFTDWAYKGEVNFFLYESAEFREDGYWEGGARVGYLDDAGWEVAAFVRNLTEEERLTGGIDFNNLTGFVNEPRTFGVEVAYRFGE